jgi:D-glycero-alpha-D-manno-heptose-7-phosphate kinase
MPWVSNEMIDACYAAARTEGALGGTFTGAEGGGFMLLYCPEPYQAPVTIRMQQAGLKRIDFAFDLGGVQILQPAFRSSQIKEHTF